MSINYSFIPTKVIEKQPVFNDIQVCPNCKSTNSYPLMNMPGSTRYCNQCKNTFKPPIIGYKEYVVERSNE